MNVLESIFSRIFPANHPAVAGVVPTENIPSPMSTPQGGLGESFGGASAGVGPMSSTPNVDVATILGGLAKNNKETLNWRSSIVDLMKLLDLDSSLQARQQLALELNYPGDTKDSAAMNTWLIHEVMERLAKNGGHIPAELKH